MLMENFSIASLLNPQNRRLFKLNTFAEGGETAFYLKAFQAVKACHVCISLTLHC